MTHFLHDDELRRRNHMLYDIAQRKRGFTLVELAIVLAVAGLLFVGLWRLLVSGNQQVRDQSASSQQQQLIAAVKGYLASTSVPAGSPVGALAGQAWLTTLGSNGIANLPLPTANSPGVCTVAVAFSTFCSFLPSGFISTTPNSYGQKYSIQVMKDSSPANSPPQTYSFMIMTVGGDTIPDTSGGRISAFIGGDGGFIYSAPATGVCGLPLNQMACGSYGTWSVNAQTTYGPWTVAPASGHIATRTYVSPTAADNLVPWLERNSSLQPDPTFSWNTMSADLYMGLYAGPVVGHSANTNIFLAQSGQAAAGGTINMMGGTVNMGAPAAAAGGGAINMADGAINMQGGTISGAGTSNIQLTSGAGSPPALITLNGAANPNVWLLDAIGSCTITVVGGVLTPNPAGCEPSINTDNLSASGTISANGFFASQFIYGPASDIRLKTNIHPIENALEDVMKLKPVSFTLKADGNRNLGIIAQDLEKVYPQLVAQDSKGMRFVNYQGLIGPLIGAVQELKKENDDLRQKLNAQEKRENQLEQEIRNNKAE